MSDQRTKALLLHQSSPVPPPPATKVLSSKDGPLVWIDCEMTGLDTVNDCLLEVACIVTDGQLERVDEGVSYVIRTDKKVLDGMNPWCINQHGKSGLTAACSDPSISQPHEAVYSSVLSYIRDRVPSRGVAVLAGNTVHADAKFLSKEMPDVIEHLHYRIVDVSTVKELIRRWYGPSHVWRGGKGEHRALEDIKGSIDELRSYREKFFVRDATDLPT